MKGRKRENPDCRLTAHFYSASYCLKTRDWRSSDLPVGGAIPLSLGDSASLIQLALSLLLLLLLLLLSLLSILLFLTDSSFELPGKSRCKLSASANMTDLRLEGLGLLGDARALGTTVGVELSAWAAEGRAFAGTKRESSDEMGRRLCADDATNVYVHEFKCQTKQSKQFAFNKFRVLYRMITWLLSFWQMIHCTRRKHWIDDSAKGPGRIGFNKKNKEINTTLNLHGSNECSQPIENRPLMLHIAFYPLDFFVIVSHLRSPELRSCGGIALAWFSGRYTVGSGDQG